MKLELKNSQINDVANPVLVIFATQSAGKAKDDLVTSCKNIPADLGKRLAPSLKDKVVTGKSQDATVLREYYFANSRHLVVVGAGLEKDLTHENIRQLAAPVLAALKSLQATSVSVHIDGLITSKKDSAHKLQGFIEGLLLSDYNFDELKTKDKKDVATEVYQSLHHSIREMLDNSGDRLNKEESELMKITESDIPYERRISLINSDDSVKIKAMEKLKAMKTKVLMLAVFMGLTTVLVAQPDEKGEGKSRRGPNPEMRMEEQRGHENGVDLTDAQRQLYSAQQIYLQAMLDVINKKATLEKLVN